MDISPCALGDFENNEKSKNGNLNEQKDFFNRPIMQSNLSSFEEVGIEFDFTGSVLKFKKRINVNFIAFKETVIELIFSIEKSFLIGVEFCNLKRNVDNF